MWRRANKISQRQKAWLKLQEASGLDESGALLPPPPDFAIDRTPKPHWPPRDFYDEQWRAKNLSASPWWRRWADYPNPQLDALLATFALVTIFWVIWYLWSL